MIFVTGYGQMCNNMLQFGHFYAFARKHKIQVIGMRFCYKYPYFNINQQKGYNFWVYVFAKYTAKLKLIPKVNFDAEGADEEEEKLLKISPLILADGWLFRDYAAFLTYRDEIASLFAFNLKVRATVDRYIRQKASGATRIGLHIRRGDYITWHGGKYHFSNAEYARLVTSFMEKEKLTNVDIFVVTNDKEFSLEKLEKDFKCKLNFLKGNPGEDLYLLSTCDYIIGPPSTFSLMAAFYQDKHLYWIMNKEKEIGKSNFRKFSYFFKNII